MAGSRPRLLRFGGNDAEAVQTLRLFRHAMHLVLVSTAATLPVIAGADSLRTYLRATVGLGMVETFRVLHLNARNGLLRDTLIATGTVDRVSVPIREVIARALELGSVAIILVHNHPSGDTRPSATDMDLTNRIMHVAKPLDIRIHDHLIVGATQMFSFREAGYLA